MKILITGATGLVGRQLCSELIKRDHSLVIVSTRSEAQFRLDFTYPCEYRSWGQLADLPDVDAVIHLAGDNISEGRWSEKKKAAILSSRIETTDALTSAFQEKKSWPRIFISTSAIGIYGDRGDEFLSEDSAPGSGFLADVCKSWEAGTKVFEEQSRLVILRVGVVLDARGGFLAKMEPIFSNGGGGRIGSGKQWLSWIHVDDLVQMYLAALENSSYRGVYNAVAPEPIRNSHWTKSYAEQMGVPARLPVPTPAIQLALGEMSQIALASQNVVCANVQNIGFQFQYPKLESALQNLYAWKQSPGQLLFTSEQWLSQHRDQVFPFFAIPENLEKITPPFLNFKILKSSTPQVEQGSLIDYELKIHGLPIRWRTLITDWRPNEFFADTQLKGPYRHWLHTHSFVSVPSGTLMQDRVVYELPMGWFGRIVASGFVRKDIRAIFNYRTKVIHEMDGKI